MKSDVVKNIWRFMLLLLLQGLVFMRISPEVSFFYYVSIFVYPIFILLLPFRTHPALLIFVSFLIGLLLDLFFYNSPGVHASACVFTAFIRPFVLQMLEPKSGYNINQSPVKRHLGLGWFASYTAVLLMAHLLFFFSVEVFTFVFLGQILLKTVFSFMFSFLFVMVYIFVFDPEE